MRYLADIIKTQKINYMDIKEICYEVEDIYPLFKFIVDTDHFDYNQFNLEMIKYVDNYSIKLVINNKYSRNLLYDEIINNFNTLNSDEIKRILKLLKEIQ